jgi:two-component system, NarL family, response regulator NreC
VGEADAPQVDVRAVVVDDHSVVRTGLKALLAADGCTIVGEATSGEEALSTVDALAAATDGPNLVVMDLTMPGIGGLEATRRLKQTHPDLNVLVLTMNTDRVSLREAFRAGASGYVLKDAVDAELLDAAKAVAAGGRYLHPSLGPELVRAEEEARARSDARGVALSRREVDVVRLVAKGYTNKEIADELFLSVRTVETHKTHIIQKTGLRARSELLRFARDAGILDEDD